MSLPAEEEEITNNGNNIAQHIFDLFLQYLWHPSGNNMNNAYSLCVLYL